MISIFAESELNMHQRVAETTNNVVTVPNAMDVASVPVAEYGLRNLDSWHGIGVAGAAFAVDFFDGKVARKLGVASPTGEMVDATTDKIKLAMALFRIVEGDYAPKSLVAAVAIQNSYNASLTVLDRKNNQEPSIHPSQFGKKAIFMQQLGIGINVIGKKVSESNTKYGRAIKTAGTVLGWTGVGVGLVASTGYTLDYARARRAKKNNQQQTAA